FLFSNTNYYRDGLVDADSTIDQFKDNRNSARHQMGSISYSEPLAKGLVMTLEYKLASDFNHNLLESFNKNTLTGRYDELDELYNKYLEYDTRKHTYNLNLNYKINDEFYMNVYNLLKDSKLSKLNKYD